MMRPAPSLRLCMAVVLGAALWSGCAPAETPPGSSATGGGQAVTGGRTGGGAGAGGLPGGSGSGGNGSGGVLGSGGAGTGGNVGTGGDSGPPATGGRPGTGGAATGGAIATGGSSGGGGSAGRGATGGAGSGGRGGATTGSGGAAGAPPSNCNLSTPVSFKKDVEPFLTNSCGKGVGAGCHVTDTMSTVGSGGFDHAYDWVTAGSHASSCPETPNPKRFEVIVAVINGANPPSCSKSRKMPPPGEGTPPTACQMAALQAWLALPKVTQMHRADDSSPTTPYPMPPYN